MSNWEHLGGVFLNFFGGARTQLDVGVLRQQHVLPLDVAVDDAVGVQVGQTLKYSKKLGLREILGYFGEGDTHPKDFPADVGDAILLQRVALGVLHQVGDGAGAAKFHHQLKNGGQNFFGGVPNFRTLPEIN